MATMSGNSRRPIRNEPSQASVIAAKSTAAQA
jgi:hypothetical protein